MLSLMAALAVARQATENISTMDLPNPKGGPPRTELYWRPDDRLNPPKLSPKSFGVGDLKQRWEFDFDVLGFGIFPDSKGGAQKRARFFVYEQERKPKNDMAIAVTRMLLRLWEHLRDDLKMEHSRLTDRQCVDVYLCWAGPAGGEQLFERDPDLATTLTVNTIYIYDIPSFTDPVEMAREVAHEYGHATMPPVGGFKTPEEWGNGYFGEKMYLLYMRDELMAGKLGPEDAMGATGPQIDAWVKQHVDPLVSAAAGGPPDVAAMTSTGPHAMNAYMGLLLYCDELLPTPVFSQILAFMKSTDPKDIPPVIQMAIDRFPVIPLKIPSNLVGRAIWVPVSGAKVVGAKVVQTKDGWAEIKPTGGEIKLVNPPP